MKKTNLLVVTGLLLCITAVNAQFMPPVRTMTIPSTDEPIQIDGIADESSWSEEQTMNLFMDEDWTGETDFSGYFRVTWDFENLYLFADIKDDIEQSANSETSDPWMFDCLDIVIDLDTNNVSSEYDENTIELRFNRGERGMTFPGRANPEDYEYALINKPDSGWLVEIAIPWKAVLPEGSPAEAIFDYISNYIGFDVVFNDSDGADPFNGDREAQLAWDLEDEEGYPWEYEMWHNTHVLGVIALGGNLVVFPEADAGPDQTVDEGTTVYLDGTNSYDPGGSELTFTWTAPSSIILDDIHSPTPSFVAPDINVDKQYGIELVVSNDSMDSHPDLVTINVNRINTPPVAIAGTDTFVYENTIIFFDGSSSSDAEDDVLSFFWHSDAGLQFNDFTSINPVVIAPEVEEPTDFNFILLVSDGEAYSDPDTVVVTVVNVTATESRWNSSNESLLVYPNPVSQNIHVKSEEFITEIEILDPAGNVLQRETLNSKNFELDLSELLTGNYLLKLKTETDCIIRKILIE